MFFVLNGDVPNFYIPYAQARYDLHLTNFITTNLFLRVGYRLDFNDEKMISYQIFNGLEGEGRFITHNIFAGIAFIMP
jgi:hypothetical protein